jgi:sulfatase maturation enzyme AslB (radical SAM superfamily)
VNNFYCGAFDHAVTFLPDGNISPCCIIKNYTKSITLLHDANRFADLKTNNIPTPCFNCTESGNNYNKKFDKFQNGIEFIDFRNSNICNLKCRTCGPHLSSSWAKELGIDTPITSTNIDQYLDDIFLKKVSNVYFAGGEPLLNIDHWILLEKLIALGISNDIQLSYSTNLTIINYKNKNIVDLWKNFKNVNVQVSVDATEKAFEYLRSGANWSTVYDNIQQLLNLSAESNIHISLAFTMSILSVWFLPDVLKYANTKNLKVNIVQLTDPNYYTLNVMPNELINDCVNLLNQCAKLAPYAIDKIKLAIGTVINNDDVQSFNQMILSVLMADKLRNENLFDLLPFKKYAKESIFKNQ